MKFINSLTGFQKILLIYAIIQIIFLFFVDIPFTSDSWHYFNTAQNCIKNGAWYPSKLNLYDDFITAPVYINILSVLLRINNSQLIIYIFNLILNLINLSLIYSLTKKIFKNEKVALLSSIIYCAYLTNLGAIFYNFTELIFTTFILLSIWLYTKNKTVFIVLSGVISFLAFNVRPLGIALFLSNIILAIYLFVFKKKFEKKIITFIITFGLSVLLTGLVTKSYHGYFVASSNTGPFNIMMGAFDGATGCFKSEVFSEGNIGCIEGYQKLTHKEREKELARRAKRWIKKNPVKWLSIFPKKMFYMFAWDDWSIPAIMDEGKWNIYMLAKSFKEKRGLEMMQEKGVLYTSLFILLNAFHQIYYMLFLGLILFGIWFQITKKELFENEILMKVLLFVIFGIGITLIAVGIPRYKYSYMIVLIPFAAGALNRVLDRFKDI